nr:RNA-directed DNA polymerase, eukaryota [Tanacetum cinerariifolium]
HLLGVGVPDSIIVDAATSLGYSIMKTPFTYLGVSVGSNMTNIKVWDDIIRKIKSWLSKWKVKTLSVGGRLTLLKSVLGATPIYWMSIYKVKWSKVFSPKKHGGLGVSSFYALNRALLFKWVWRFISQSNSLWARVISSIHGSNFQDHALSHASPWTSIICKVQVSLDRLPTTVNLAQRGIQVSSLTCPVCSLAHESTSHILFNCSMALDIARLIVRWWDLSWSPIGSYAEWLSWFKDICMGAKLKSMLEGVFFVSWWAIWNFRNKLLFDSRKPKKNVLFDDIVARSFAWCNARCNLFFLE